MVWCKVNQSKNDIAQLTRRVDIPGAATLNNGRIEEKWWKQVFFYVFRVSRMVV